MSLSPAQTSPIFSKPKLPFSWPSRIITNPIPHRYRRKLRSKLHSRQSPASSISSLDTSFSPLVNLRRLRKHRWSLYDVQYPFVIILLLFSASITPGPAPWIKTVLACLAVAAALMPITSQFLLPFLPIGTWLIFFFSCRFIPSDVRPHIWVKVLPALENILYGANLSNILSKHQFVILDVLAWLPYGIIHYAGPAVCSLVMFVFAAPGTVPVFARSFGYMNLIGAAIQMTFPCSPPWYENLHGLAPANYAMEGSPAGLARIDQLFGVDLYTTNFINSPLVFGAFPSLHAGSAVLEALFMSYCFPRFRPLFAAYTMWLWWATMYLSHHYAVDLVGGSFISAIVFYIARANFLPRRQADKTTRWDYDFVEVGPGAAAAQEYDLAEMGYRSTSLSNDEWTIASSSGSASPLGDDNQSLWEGETLAERESDRESQVGEIGVRG